MDIKPKEQLLFERIGSSWFSALYKEFNKEYFNNLKLLVSQEYKNYKTYPLKEDIFKAFKSVPFKEVRCVWLGQDPYPHYHANGLCFGTNMENEPDSLRLIFNEIERQYKQRPTDKTLNYLTQQGVLLLNSRLTVRENYPDSHSLIGWDIFIKKAIQKVNNRNYKIPIITFGSIAKNLINDININKNTPIYILEHPAYAKRNNREWLSKNVFKEVNYYFQALNLQQIEWVQNLQ